MKFCVFRTIFWNISRDIIYSVRVNSKHRRPGKDMWTRDSEYSLRGCSRKTLPAHVFFPLFFSRYLNQRLLAVHTLHYYLSNGCYYSYQRFWHVNEAYGHFPLCWLISLVWMQPKTKQALPAGSTVIIAICSIQCKKKICINLYYISTFIWFQEPSLFLGWNSQMSIRHLLLLFFFLHAFSI